LRKLKDVETNNVEGRENEQAAQGNVIERQHVMEIQVNIDQECTRESSTRQNGEQQEEEALEEREGTRVFPEDDDSVVRRACDEEEKELIRKVLNEIRKKKQTRSHQISDTMTEER